MVKVKTILFDLDGTLTDTMHPAYAKYRDGKERISTSSIPVFPGAKELIYQLKHDGHQVFIVSDSHPRFVEPIAREIFDVCALSLAYKPNTDKIQQFINDHSELKLSNAKSRIFLIGDTRLDVYAARKLRIPSVLLMHQQNYQPEVWSAAQKGGPTFSCKSFSELYS